MDNREKRRRSGALHANTQEEYLKKLEVEDTKKPAIQRSVKSMSYDSFNQVFADFDFIDQLEPEDIFVDQPTEQQYHRILVISEDLGLSHKRINEIIDNIHQNDGISNSTSDDVKPYMEDSDCVLPIDIYFIKKTFGQKQHIFQLWIQNSFTNQLINLFEEIYYKKFDALVYCVKDYQNYENANINRIKTKLSDEAKFFKLVRNSEICSLKKIKISHKIQTSEIFCNSLSEAIAKLVQ